MVQKLMRLLQLIILNSVSMSNAMPSGPRQALLRRLGVRLGTGATFAAGCHLRGTDVVVGDGSRVGLRVFLDGPIRIGKEVSVGTDARLLGGTHELGDGRRRAGRNVAQPIVVGDGAWIGAGATIMGGVTIGEGCVVAAGAVVIEDTKADSLYAGVPAVYKRGLPDVVDRRMIRAA